MYLIGKGLVGEIRGGHPETLSRLLIREHSGRVLDSRLRGCGFEPHRRHCVVSLEQDTSILRIA